MILRSIALRDFRSYQEERFSFQEGVNIVCGDNGRGKTNLLEAVWMLTGVRSWRTAKKGEAVRWEAEKAVLRGEVFSGGREKTLLLELPAAGRSAVWVNGVKKKSPELGESLRCVLFSPEDISLIKGSAAGRREFLDGAISQLRPRYGELIARYGHLLDQKSRLLKQEDPHPSAELIAAFDQQLASIGALLIGYRARFCRGLGEESAKIHQAISHGKECLSLEYQTVKTVVDPFAPPETLEGQLMDHLEAHRQAELQSGTCLSGLHKDELFLSINGRAARAYASQGQTRSAALALKFAQRELYCRDGGEYPVLLLDDVLSELDAPRQAFVSGHALGGQSIITCCEERKEFSGARLLRL